MLLKSLPHSATKLSGDSSSFTVGVIASLILHSILLSLILVIKPQERPAALTGIEVSIEPATSLKRAQPQIVSPNSAPAEAPEDSDKLSDRDSRADIEQIKRGIGGSGIGANAGLPGGGDAIQLPPPQPRQISTANKPNSHKHREDKAHSRATKQSAPGSDKPLDLKLDESTLVLKFGNHKTSLSKSSGTEEKKPQQEITERSLAQRILESPTSKPSFNTSSSYQAFSRPAGSGAAFLGGGGGTSDHLPNLPDGDITLLNAKANIYASFVRRVAIQVFNQLRAEGWESLSAREIREISDFTTVRATMSPAGRLISAEILERSGSSRFDDVVKTSATKGSADPNPPAGAKASDGMIHFIFKARSWTQLAVNRRSGAPFEQRWILLATGLE